jgi:hypothetical protein
MVGEAAADAVRSCPRCGGPIQVPSWQELRRRVGLPGHNISPEMMIEHLLAAGELPPDDFCAACRVRKGRPVNVWVRCEREWVDTGRGSRGFGLLALLFFWPLLFWYREGSGKTHGRDKEYPLPLPLCDTCRPSVYGEVRIKECLNTVEPYRRLLDKFPDAEVRMG